MTKPSLDGAYALKTPQDSVELYGAWAEAYDMSFAQSSGYQLPELVAQAYAKAGGSGPVLDVGAGTGLVGAALARHRVGPVDGTDISPHMLAEAALKDCYENLFEGDLTARLSVEDASYAGIISAGTFTHGHVGPEAFDELLRVARGGALIVLSINADHFEGRGFAAKFDDLGGAIDALTLTEVPIYAGSQDAVHADDRALIACFRKSE
jgi:SAM-dependent methyltransferase